MGSWLAGGPWVKSDAEGEWWGGWGEKASLAVPIGNTMLVAATTYRRISSPPRLEPKSLTLLLA